MSSHESRPGLTGGYTDPDLTPKPLRITKQRTPKYSDPVPISQLPSLSNTHSQQDLNPIRRSSVCSNHTQLDLSQQDPAAPTSQWARRNTFLHMDKQRRSDPGYTSMAAHSNGPDSIIVSESSSSLQRTDDLGRNIIVGAALGSHADARRAGTEATHAGTRAVTTGTFKETDLLKCIDDEALIHGAPKPLARSRRRAVTTNGGLHSNMESTRDTTNTNLPKPSSTKPRLISRMMSGLTNRAHSSHAASREDDQTMQQQQRNHTGNFNERETDSMDAVRRSCSSAETDKYGGSDLEGALSAFPTPPTTAGTSPRAAGLGVCSRRSSQQYRSICKPDDAATLGGQLTLTPEYDQLSPDNGKTMYVAIDVEGAFNTTINGQDLWSRHTGLDVVVIIDNSLCTSPSTLMASCETARFLASILNIVTDRLAILCTSNFDTQSSKSTMIWPLTPIKMQKLKGALDTVTSSGEKLEQESWARAIDCAKVLLMQSVVPDQTGEVLQDTFGHVFILSANTSCMSTKLLTHDKLNFHTICPAIIAQKAGQVVGSGGWRLRSLSANEPRAVSLSKDTDPSSLFNRIRGLIAHARGGKLPGKLHDVVLSVEPGLDCSIEGAMGSRQWSILNPGEQHSVLVKLKIRTPKARGYSFNEATSQSGTPTNTDDVLSELDEMLGVSAVKILTATLRYRCPLLPNDTTCFATVDCQVKKHFASPDQSNIVAKSNRSPPSAGKVLIQKRLAYHLATHGSPRHALSNVRKEFGETGMRSVCPDYVGLIIKELRFQARIVERLEIDASPKKSISDPLSNEPNSPFEHFGQGLFQAANYRPDDWITSAIDEGVSSNEEVQLAVLSNGKLKDKKSSKWLYSEPSEAEVIWNGMQKASNPQLESSVRYASRPKHLVARGQGRRAASSGAEQDRHTRVREIDGWAKGNVRANTLRSIGSFVDSRAREVGAPRL